MVIDAGVYCVGVEDSSPSAVCVRSPKGRERVGGFWEEGRTLQMDSECFQKLGLEMERPDLSRMLLVKDVPFLISVSNHFAVSLQLSARWKSQN